MAAANRYVTAYEGNLSARLPGGHILITPTRVNKAMIRDEDLVVTDLAGNRIQGTRAPSSERQMHTTVYAERPDVMAVVHGHPPYATAFAVAGREMCIDCMPETWVELRSIPLVPYGTPGSHEVSDRLRECLDRANVFLLKQHGVLAMGADIDEAYFRLEMVEHAAQILHLAESLGGAQNLDAAAKAKLEKVIRGGVSCSGR
jgi:L-fuculose-phosphate aldolase